MDLFLPFSEKEDTFVGENEKAVKTVCYNENRKQI